MKTIITVLLILLGLNANAQEMNKDSTHSTEIIRYQISPEGREKFLQAYADAGKYLQASEYCLGYEIIQGVEEPGNFIVTITWTSKDDHMNGFRKSSEFMPFFQLVKPYYASIQEMKHYIEKTSWKKK